MTKYVGWDISKKKKKYVGWEETINLLKVGQILRLILTINKNVSWFSGN
jgi:hypothetical protein